MLDRGSLPTTGVASRPPRCRRSLACLARPKPKSYFEEDLDPSEGVRELWGQSKERDLVRDRQEGELLWNVPWEQQLDAEAKAVEAKAARRDAVPEPQRGFLSLSRSLALDDPSVELESPRLQSAAAAKTALEEGLAPLSAAMRPAGGPAYAPTRGERKTWSRTAKFTRSSTSKDVRDAKLGEQEQETERAKDLARYAQLKQELLWFTGATGASVTLALVALYDGETAASYALGAGGGVLYLRLLSRSVDSKSGDGVPSLTDAVEGMVGGQRLLIPALLVAGWNRWNALAAPLTGVELHILPMLAGFFTYKLSSLFQIVRDIFPAREAET
jgi:ATP synthase protein I